MSGRRWEGHDGSVIIRITVEVGHPLSGRIGPEGASAEPFAGWLQLLEMLTRLVEPAASSGTAGGSSGDLGPRAHTELGQDV